MRPVSRVVSVLVSSSAMRYNVDGGIPVDGVRVAVVVAEGVHVIAAHVIRALSGDIR